MSCPICGKETVHKYRPFCSRHCADVDLGRWMTGGYAIPVTVDEDEDGDSIADRTANPAPRDPKVQ